MQEECDADPSVVNVSGQSCLDICSKQPTHRYPDLCVIFFISACQNNVIRYERPLIKLLMAALERRGGQKGCCISISICYYYFLKNKSLILVISTYFNYDNNIGILINTHHHQSSSDRIV